MAGGLALLAALAGGAVAETAPVAILFDASGSMWGKLDNERQSKLVLARDALRQSLPRHMAGVAVGFATFPSRRRSDCQEAETVLKPEPFALEPFSAVLEKVNPKGKGPLVQGLREAAKMLGATAGPAAPATIVVLHDDADNCGQDACAAAQEIRRTQPRLTIHVLGLGIKPEEVSRASCVAVVTGGRFVNARDAATLASALDDMLRLAAREGRPQPVAPPPAAIAAAATVARPVAAVRALPVGRADGPPGLALAAQLLEGGPPAEPPDGTSVRWRVTPEAEPDREVYAGEAATPEVALPPGKYRVEANLGLVTARRGVELGDMGTLAVPLVLGAGLVDLAVVARKGGPPLAQALITIAEAAPSGQPSKGGRPLAVLEGPRTGLAVPAGNYLVTAEHGLARRASPLVVTAGARVSLELILGSGTLQLAVGNGGVGTEPLDRVALIVFEDDPDAPSGRREVARSAAAQAELQLPVGTYYVHARLGEVEVRERVSVSSGETTVRDIVLPVGRLALQSSVRGGRLEAGDGVAYDIERIDGPAGQRWRTSNPAPTFDLPAGRYRVESRIGQANARVVRELQLKAGDGQKLVLEHDAGRVRLRLADTQGGTVGGLALADVFWEIRDGAGALAWSSARSEARLWLQAGAYKVQVTHRDRRAIRALLVKAGEEQTLDPRPE